jgi:hypothetical protein
MSFKKIIPVLLLVIFLTPLAGKFFHHHDDQVCVFNGHHDCQVIKANCSICNFELNAFAAGFQKISHQICQLSDNYYFATNPNPLINTGFYSFSLRAPPLNKKFI